MSQSRTDPANRTSLSVIKTMADKDAMTFATRRLLHDFKEMMTCKIPTVGVSAFPLDHSLFEWACNILGPEGTMYEGGVFHFHLHFPTTYPHHPPVVQVRSSFPHPSLDGTIQVHDVVWTFPHVYILHRCSVAEAVDIIPSFHMTPLWKPLVGQGGTCSVYTKYE